MDKELKELVFEIVTLVLILLIAVPICVSASNKYQQQKEVLLTGINTSVDISSNSDGKTITIYSNYDEKVRVNLILKINKFSNDYIVSLDDNEFDLKEVECKEDSEYRYYNLGIYEVNRVREFDFQFKLLDKAYYDETISYSFITDGQIWRE